MNNSQLTDIVTQVAFQNNHYRLFWTALDNVYDDARLQSYIANKGLDPINQKLSAGVSVKQAPKVLLNELICSVKNDEYRFYTPSSGSRLARQAIAIKETVSAGLKQELDPENVVLSVGSTGAISAVFEYIKRTYPKGTVLIAAPTYYLYGFCARYFKLPYSEVYSLQRVNDNTSSFLCADEILKRIDDSTKLICIVNPTNPTGETYSEDDITRILRKAKKADCLVLVDELFSGLSYGTRSIKALQIAERTNTTNNLIVINGLSKGLNLAGFRVGYSICTKREVTSHLALINQARYCFPIGYQVDSMIALDSIFSLIKSGMQTNTIVAYAQSLGLKYDIKELLAKFTLYEKDVDDTLQEYRTQLDFALNNLQGTIVNKVESKFGFNSFVQISVPKGANQFDFAVNCYLETGVKIEVGPCFGLSQPTWENYLGLWVRLTTARESDTYKTALTRFVVYVEQYTKGTLNIKTEIQFT